MAVNQKQLESVLRLPGPRRFERFVKVVADRQQVWGLFEDGWALAATDDGTPVFPFWPEMEYAQICAVNEWSGYAPRAIELAEFMDVLLPKLKADGVLPGIFFTPSSKGVTPTVDDVLEALNAELENY